jgi:hypothetical protein
MVHRIGDAAPSVPHQPFLSVPVDAATMNAIEHALLAVIAAESGDPRTALEQLSRAQRYARTTARRERQIVQIAALVIAGKRERAAGLTLEHAVDFPEDAELLARVAGATR